MGSADTTGAVLLCGLRPHGQSADVCVSCMVVGSCIMGSLIYLTVAGAVVYEELQRVCPPL
jgi:hypothetical protein